MKNTKEYNPVIDTLEVYLTPTDVAKHLGFSMTKTYALIKEPGFPRLRFGKDIRIPLKEYQQYLKDKKKHGLYY